MDFIINAPFSAGKESFVLSLYAFDYFESILCHALNVAIYFVKNMLPDFIEWTLSKLY